MKSETPDPRIESAIEWARERFAQGATYKEIEREAGFPEKWAGRIMWGLVNRPRQSWEPETGGPPPKRPVRVAFSFKPVRFCGRCGEGLAAEHRFCARCGQPVSTGSVPEPEPEPKKRARRRTK